MREPTNTELAAHMGVSEEAIQKHLSEINTGAVLSFEDLLQSSINGNDAADVISAGEDSLPEKGLMQNELREQLIKAIESLNEKERTVISLYYYEHLKLAEIAKVMGVSESRVSQNHSKAILKMKSIISDYLQT
jgi:RNA polymerase sigma factor for flagellar operon FliA